MLESMWGHYAFDSVSKHAEGKSGGIIAMWDTSKFSIQSSFNGDRFVVVMGNWIPLNTTCLFIVVYAPQDPRKKKQLWLDLKAVIDSANVLSLVMEMVKQLADLEHKKIKDLHQKAKVRWAIEGDENSGYFHGIFNNRINRSRINAIAINGTWITDPITIKEHTFYFFESKFKESNHSRPSFSSNLFKHLSLEQNSLLSNPFTTQEIKDSVWDCGGDKAPGPDGFSFKLIKKHRNLLGIDIVSYVHEFYHSANIPRGCNSSFIILVPKIEDPITITDFRPIIYQIILTCFHIASWHKVSFNKSKLFGIGVPSNDVNSMAHSIGFLPSQLPCIYLGLPIGANMTRFSNWTPLVERFQKLLSKWKCKALYYGGRLTLIKSVLEFFRRSFCMLVILDLDLYLDIIRLCLDISVFSLDFILNPKIFKSLSLNLMSPCNLPLVPQYGTKGNLVEEVLVHQSLQKTLKHVLELSSYIYLSRLNMSMRW
ncbi:hypothetical protein Tco_0531724 [Tanacetum coccineum]